MRKRSGHWLPEILPGNPLATAIRRSEWELASLLLLNALVKTAHASPPGTVDDVLAMLSDMEDGYGPRR